MPLQTSVLVIGGGPVGLALAGDLGWRGIDCRMVEAGAGQISQPKMDMVGIRSMEFCRRWGIVAQVESAGYNRDYPQDCAWVTHLNGYEFGRERFPSPAAEKPPVHSPQKRERCPQNFFDPVLRRFAASHPSVQLSFNTELLDFKDLGTHVQARLRNTGSGAIETVEADYLVGCDGGGSAVRQSLGIEMQGEPVLTYTTNVVFRCDGLEKLHHMQPGYRYIFIGPEGTWATLVAINGRDQWRFSLVGDAQKRKLTEEEARTAIVRANPAVPWACRWRLPAAGAVCHRARRWASLHRHSPDGCRWKTTRGASSRCSAGRIRAARLPAQANPGRTRPGPA